MGEVEANMQFKKKWKKGKAIVEVEGKHRSDGQPLLYKLFIFRFTAFRPAVTVLKQLHCNPIISCPTGTSLHKCS